MNVAYEHELQGLLTPLFRRAEVVSGFGLMSYGSMAGEAKLVCGEPGTLRLEAKTEKVFMVVSGDEEVLFDKRCSLPWFACTERLGWSRIEEVQRVSLLRAGGQFSTGEYGNAARRKIKLNGKALVHKISDSAVGVKPFDFFVMWGVWSGYALGWTDGEIVRAYLIEARRLEEELAKESGNRGSIGEAQAFEWSLGVVCWGLK